MAKSVLSPEDESDAVSVLSSRTKFPKTLHRGDLIRELSFKLRLTHLQNLIRFLPSPTECYQSSVVFMYVG